MTFEESIEQILKRDRRYKLQAYNNVRLGLDRAQHMVHGDVPKSKKKISRHVSGPQLLEGFRVHIIESYGPMSYQLLKNWGLDRTEDVGNIVFNLIDTGLFGKSETDTLEDFLNVYDFKETFLKPFDPL